MLLLLLVVFLSGACLGDVGIAGIDLETSESSWASDRWSKPWGGSWKDLVTHAQDAYTQDLHPKDSYKRELPYDLLQKRHLIHYIPSENPPDLERPRQRHFDIYNEPLFDIWEQPPLLAKEGITSEEAAWVPQGQPLKLIKQGYSWGSKEFDQSFGRNPPLVVETHMNYDPLYSPPYDPLPVSSPHPPSTYPSSPSPPPFSPPSTSLPLPPPTSSPSSPYTPSVENHHPGEIHHAPPPYHPSKPPQYQPIVLRYPDTPRKYYLTEEHPPSPKNQYGLRKYFLSSDPPIVNTGGNFAKIPFLSENEIEDIKDYTDAPKQITEHSLTPGTSTEQLDEGKVTSDQLLSSKDHRNPPTYERGSAPHPIHEVPYGYRLQPRLQPAIHSHYPQPPYGHYLHQRPHYPVPHPYPPTPGVIRKYYLSPPEISTTSPPSPPPPPPSSPEEKQEDSVHYYTADEGSSSQELPAILSPFDLRMPRSTSSVNWHLDYGRKI